MREIFRKKIQSVLAEKYNFYAFAPKPTTYAEGYLQDNLKTLLGKVYAPFDNQEMFVLALDQTDPLQENEDILQALSEHFYITQQGAYKIGQDPAAQLSELGYTQGAEAPEEDEEYILLSSIDKKANQNADDILAGKACTFVSGYHPSDRVDLQSIKYIAPLSNHYANGAYQVRSINIAYIEGALRLKFNLGEYRPFKEPINYGIDRQAATGIAMTRSQLAARAGIPTPSSFYFFFFFFDE